MKSSSCWLSHSSWTGFWDFLSHLVTGIRRSPFLRTGRAEHFLRSGPMLITNTSKDLCSYRYLNATSLEGAVNLGELRSRHQSRKQELGLEGLAVKGANLIVHASSESDKLLGHLII